MFLTDAELRELTSYAHRAKQVAELRRMGIAFHLNAAGRPIVARAVFEGGNTVAPQPKAREPKWAALQP